GATSSGYTLTQGIAVPTDFRFKVTCTLSDQSDVSNTIAIGLNPASECYCTPIYSFGCNSGDRITNVSLQGESASLNNTTTCSANSYGDFTNLTIRVLFPGETYAITVSTDAFPGNSL